jgi:hypothetical protein
MTSSEIAIRTGPAVLGPVINLHGLLGGFGGRTKARIGDRAPESALALLSAVVSLRKARVAVIDGRCLSAGATGRSGALVRANYDNRADAQLALMSLEVFSNWKDRIVLQKPTAAGFPPNGSLLKTLTCHNSSSGMGAPPRETSVEMRRPHALARSLHAAIEALSVSSNAQSDGEKRR